MCGVAGFFKIADTSKEQDQDIFNLATELFDETSLRGTDASGFSYFKKSNGELITTKGPISSSEMVKNPLWLKIADAVPNSMIMHARAMTKGSEFDNMNNHPLVIDKRISVIHNGGIWNDDNLREQFHLPSKGQVDSEVIPMMIDKYLKDISHMPHPMSLQNARAINLTSQSIMGSYACAMLNKDIPNMMYLFNHKNPITLAYVESLNTVFFSSTKNIMERAFDKPANSMDALSIFKAQKHQPRIYEVPDNTLIVFGVYEKEVDPQDEFVKNAILTTKKFSLSLYNLNVNEDTPFNKSSVTKALTVTEEELKKLLVKKNPLAKTETKITTYTTYPAGSTRPVGPGRQADLDRANATMDAASAHGYHQGYLEGFVD